MIMDRVAGNTVGIALGGGVVWGAAHIGVLERLEAAGIRIDAISGTSAGSIVAALYAFGIDLDTMHLYTEELRRKDIFRVHPSRMGLASSRGVGQVMRRFLGDARIEDAKIPLYIPAVDVTTGEPHLFEGVTVAEAVMASSAIPGIFAPVRVGTALYVDGSLLADVPCQILKMRGLDFVIGVELVDREGFLKEPASLFEVIMKSMRIMMNETRIQRLRYADVVIDPDVHDVGQFDFDRAGDLILRGREAAEQRIETIEQRLSQGS